MGQLTPDVFPTHDLELSHISLRADLVGPQRRRVSSLGDTTQTIACRDLSIGSTRIRVQLV